MCLESFFIQSHWWPRIEHVWGNRTGGMVNFYNLFLPRAAHLQQPVDGALRLWKAIDKIDWIQICSYACPGRRGTASTSCATGIHSSYDWFSRWGVGAVASEWQHIALFSHKLRDEQRVQHFQLGVLGVVPGNKPFVFPFCLLSLSLSLPLSSLLKSVSTINHWNLFCSR